MMVANSEERMMMEVNVRIFSLLVILVAGCGSLNDLDGCADRTVRMFTVWANGKQAAIPTREQAYAACGRPTGILSVGVRGGFAAMGLDPPQPKKQVAPFPGISWVPPMFGGPPPSLVPFHNVMEGQQLGSGCPGGRCNASAMRFGASYYVAPSGQTTTGVTWHCPTCDHSGTSVNRTGPDGFVNYRAFWNSNGVQQVRGTPDPNTIRVGRESVQAAAARLIELAKTAGKQ